MAFSTSEEFISRTEHALGMRLPDSVRAHLLADNGGELIVDDDGWSVIPVADSSDRKRVARSANHLVAETAKARMWAGFPTRAVPIAQNGTGNFLVLLPEDRDTSRLAPAIYLWDHETGLHHWLADDLSELEGFRGGAA